MNTAIDGQVWGLVDTVAITMQWFADKGERSVGEDEQGNGFTREE